MDTKIIGILLLICAGLIFQYGYEDFAATLSPSVKLKKTLEKDVAKSLQQQTQKDLSNIHHVEVVYRSTDAQEFLKKHPLEFQTHKQGSVWLEIEVVDLQDNENPGFITQTSVFDLKSKNKISEFGQTYYFKDFDKDIKIKVTADSPLQTPTQEDIQKKATSKNETDTEKKQKIEKPKATK